MNLIPCAKDCKHQLDGYCGLKGIETVTGSANDCCHYSSHLTNNYSNITTPIPNKSPTQAKADS